jgi:hypothetical protein
MLSKAERQTLARRRQEFGDCVPQVKNVSPSRKASRLVRRGLGAGREHGLIPAGARGAPQTTGRRRLADDVADDPTAVPVDFFRKREA